MPEIREQQAQMAREAGIEGFCYWNYYLDSDKKLLERPIEEVIKTGSPDFPFCIGWANHTWSNKTWLNKSLLSKDTILAEQKYSEKVYSDYFNYLLPAFKDPRYITVNGKPLVVVFAPNDIPDPSAFASLWKKLAIKNGLKGIYLVGIVHNIRMSRDKVLDTNGSKDIYDTLLSQGFDGVNPRGYFRAEILCKGRVFKYFKTILQKFFKTTLLDRYDYNKILDYMYTDEDKRTNVYPTIMPNWDRSPRSGKKAVIYENTTPATFKRNITQALELVQDRPEEQKLIFAKSWNEWGEGNHLEPDLKYGKGYLDVLSSLINKK